MKFKNFKGKIISAEISKYKKKKNTKWASEGERKLFEKLEKLFPDLIYYQMPCFGTRLKLDFYIHLLKIAFEYDGIQHQEYIVHFHKSKRGYNRHIDRDLEKEEWCKINGIRLIRINQNNINELEELIRGNQ